MKLQKTLYPALLIATLTTEGVALGIIPSGEIPEKFKNFQKNIKQNTVPFALMTATVPLAIDAMVTGRPLTALGMSVLSATNTLKLLKDSKEKNKALKFIDTHSNSINALGSGLSLAQNFVTGNPKIINCFSPAMFVATSVGNELVKRKVITNPNAPKALSANFMVACMLLAHNLFKAGKTPQALLALNISMIIGKKLHDDYKKSK